MNYRRLFVLVFICALAFVAPALQAAGGGAATNIDDNNVCYWRCNNGKVGRAQMSSPSGSTCLNLCAAACAGPCIALY